MQRRGWTVAVGAVLVAVLTWVVLSMDVPYVAYVPGPTVDTLGTDDGKAGGNVIIRIEGISDRAVGDDRAGDNDGDDDGDDSARSGDSRSGDRAGSKGELRLVTVSVIPRPRLVEALWYWYSDDYAVVPREFVYPPDKTEKEIERESREQFASSQASAETAALRALGCPVRVTVNEVSGGSPFTGRLRPGDVVQKVDGRAVTSVKRLEALFKREGRHTLSYLRDGRPGTVDVPAAASSGGKLPGLDVTQRQPCRYDVVFDKTVQEIGGPSAGLIFALGVVDLARPGDLTGDRVVAGTGEISDDGVVGAVGGIPQKLRAARRDGAEVFLTPKANCPEAVANNPGGLRLVEVSTLADTIDALTALQEGHEPPTCAA